MQLQSIYHLKKNTVIMRKRPLNHLNVVLIIVQEKSD